MRSGAPALTAILVSGLLAFAGPTRAAALIGPQVHAVVQAAPAPSRPPRYGYEVIAVFPHDSGAFTQGLAFHEGVLLESTGRAPSTVRRVRLEDGVVLARRELGGDYFGEGLAVVGDRAVSLTWTHGVGFVWKADDLTPVATFGYVGEGWGLAWDGRRLILSDGTATLRFLDPDTFAPTGSVSVHWQGRPVGRLNELEVVDDEVWANVWQTDVIVRIDPATGAIVGVIDLAGLLPDRAGMNPEDDVLNGIAWDPGGRRLFVTGKNWPSLFEIRLTGPH